MRTTRRIAGLCGLLAGLGLGADAADITWGSPADITGDTDVSTNGISVFAASFDDDTASVTVNGVTFAGGAGASTVRDSSVYGDDLTYSVNNDHSSAFTSGADPFNSLTSDYKELLNGAVYSSLAGDVTVPMTLGNLTAGLEYEVQFWVNDPRISSDRWIGVSDGVSTTLVNYCVDQAAGSPGQYIIGTFTADAETQSFDLFTTNGGWQLNALQLRTLSDVTLYSVDPTEVDLNLVWPSTAVTGSVDTAFSGSASSVDVDVFVEGTYSSAFSVLPPASFSMTDQLPSNTTVEIVFDNSSAGLANGETATGMVHFVFNDSGSSAYTTNVVPVVVRYIEDIELASVFYQAGGMNTSDDWNNAFWTNVAYTTPQVPSAGNTYISLVAGQTRAGTSPFAGDSLELRGTGSVLGLKTGTVTVSNLILNAGTAVANYGGGNILAGAISSATNNGAGSVTFSSGGNSRNINIEASMTIGSNITSMVVNMGTHESAPDEYVSVNSTSNVFSGVWNVTSGHLVGNAEGSLGTAGFVVGDNGTLNFNYDYDGTGKTLEVGSGGILVLDQDLVFEEASLGPWPLDAGTYTAAELLADAAYSNMIDAASTATLTVLSDPSAYKLAIFTFSETNGVSSDVFAYTDVSDWGLTNAGAGAAFSNSTYTAFNETANVDALSVANNIIDPTAADYHSFSFAVEGLPPGAVLDLHRLNLDYICQSPLNFRLLVYSSVSGQGTNTFMTGDTPLYDTGTINAAGTYDVDVPLTNAVFQGLDNGDSVEFRFVITDSSSSAARIHGIDNVFLTGLVDDSLGPQVGEIVVGITGTNAVVGWTGESGAAYIVQYDNDLVIAPGWSNVTESISGIEGAMSFTNALVDPVGFFRVIVE